MSQKRFVMKNFGCKTNYADAQRLSLRLIKNGWTDASGANPPELCLVNSCSVTERSEKKVLKQALKFKKQYHAAKIVVCGCVSEVLRKNIQAESGFDSIDAVLKDGIDEHPIFPEAAYPRYFLKIQNGCDNFCSYCIVPFLRGKPQSRGFSEIERELNDVVRESNPAEVVISGTNVCSYKSAGLDLYELLCRISERYDFRIRISSLSLPFEKDFIKNISGIKNLCPHFAVPLESGSDRILKKMFRNYTVKQYLESVSEIRTYFNDPAVTTDVMFGFPGEDEADFEDSLRIIQKVSFSKVHVFPYSPRDITLAGLYEGIPARFMKLRKARILRKVNETERKYKEKFIGHRLKVVVEEEKNGLFSGMSENYIKVLFRVRERSAGHPVPKGGMRCGDVVSVTVEKIEGNYALGRAEEILWKKTRKM